MSTDAGFSETIEKVVKIRRCAAVVKGGRRFSFAAMTVVGDGNGKVGWGYGKANEVPPSVEKANKQASREMVEVPIVEGTIPHLVKGRYGAGKVILVPAAPGTNNSITLVKATFDALAKLRTRQETERLRGVSLS